MIKEQEKKDIKSFYSFQKQIQQSITKDLLEKVHDIPSFKEILESMSPEEMEKNSQISREMQEGAIFSNKWTEFLTYQSTQGELYAKLGVPIRDWFDLTSELRYSILKNLQTTDLGEKTDVYKILRGLEKYVDLSLVSIAEGYLQAKQNIIQDQLQAIKELSTPILQIREKLLAIPLIGIIDSVRAKQMTKDLLYKIKEKKASIIILDITGVPIVDTKVANHLIQSAKAVQLMGGIIIITGISPEIAETMVSLGADLEGIKTLTDLEAGIQEANKLLDLKQIKLTI